MPTPAQVIPINNISGYLAANSVANGALFSPYTDPRLPLMLYMEGAALSWGNKYGASQLQAVANYVYALDGKFGSTAQAIIAGGGGGSIAPITPPSANVNPIEFVVAASGTPIVNGGSTLSIPSYKGLNVLFNRNGSPQSQVNSQDTYFNWNPVTCIFTCFPAAVTSELFSINPNI